MIDYTTPTQDLLWIAKRLKGVLELAPVLEELGSLENAALEANNRVLALKAEGDRLAEGNARVAIALEDSRKAQEATLRETELKVADIEARAVVDAQRARDELTKAANDEVLVAKKKKAELDRKISDQETAIKNLDEQIADREARKSALLAEIEAIKAKF